MSLYELGCFKQGSRQRYKRPKPNTLLKKMKKTGIKGPSRTLLKKIKKKITKSKMHITPTKILQWIFFIAHPKLQSPVCLCTKDAARGHVVAPGNHAGRWRVNWWEKIGIWEREITALVLLNTISNLSLFPAFTSLLFLFESLSWELMTLKESHEIERPLSFGPTLRKGKHHNQKLLRD